MPNVGGKKFPYTAAGKKAALAAKKRDRKLKKLPGKPSPKAKRGTIRKVMNG